MFPHTSFQVDGCDCSGSIPPDITVAQVVPNVPAALALVTLCDE